MTSAADLFAHAVRQHQSGRLADAEALYRQTLAADPGHAPAHHHLGLIAAAAGVGDAAARYIAAATELDPTYAAAWSDLARLLLNHDPQRAAAAAERAANLAPFDPGVRGLAALALGAAGRWDAVAQLWRAALTRAPDDLEALNGLGAALIESGRPAEAIPPLRQAQRLAPGYAEIDGNLALALQRAGAPAEAAALYMDLFRRRPDLIDAANDAGVIWMELGDPAAAARCFDAALSAQPDFVAGWTNRGLALSTLGRLEEALACYDEALRCDPSAAVVHNNRAALLTDLNRLDDAEAAVRAAVALTPDDPHPWINLSTILVRMERMEDAVAAARAAVDRAPDAAGGLCAYGLALLSADQPAAAVDALGRAAALSPDDLSVANNYAAALVALGLKSDEDAPHRQAAALLEQLVARRPDHPEAWKNLGSARLALKQGLEAEQALRRAISLRPDYFDAQADLGAALQTQERHQEALDAYLIADAQRPGQSAVQNNIGACYSALAKAADRRGDKELLVQAENWFRAALDSKPDFAEAWRNLGVCASARNDLGEAEDCFRRTLELEPDHAVAMGNLGTLLQTQARYGEALALLRRSLALKPDQDKIAVNLGVACNNAGLVEEGLAFTRLAVDRTHEGMHGFRSNLIFNSHFSTTTDDAALLVEATRWDEIYGVPRRGDLARRPRPNGGPDKILHVGIVSHDFRHNHVVMRHFLPLAERRDPNQWRLTLLSDSGQEDQAQQQLLATRAVWRDIHGMSDDEVVALCREEAFDILIDLSGHTAGNRLRVFASAPAPLQLTWLGYFDTTGLAAMDALVADSICVPPEHERWFVEHVARLPDGFVCWRPPESAPEPGPLPARAAGHVTLGCANQFSKINADVAALWAQILRAAPTARLVMKTTALKDADVRARGEAMFAAAGAPMERVTFEPGGSPQDILDFYTRVDLALDPFPVVGGATTCEALWMGVPVITLLGARFCGRHSASHVTNAGHPEFITTSADAYCALALSLINDLDRLEGLRSRLRADMAAAPITDEARFARNFEAMLRDQWRRTLAKNG